MAEELQTFHLDIVSAEEQLFKGRVKTMQISGCEGQLGIRHGHAPLLTLIKPGRVSFVLQDDSESMIYISGGILEVQPETVTVLADTAIRADDIDETKVAEAVRQAQEKISNNSGDVDYGAPIIELAKATAQLRVVELTRSGRGSRTKKKK